MDARLEEAAYSGDIVALYALIREDADVFRPIDRMEFVDTPLHIAAAMGHTDFAMEVMNLKPSFARKLNQDGLSPIHLALQNEKTDMVIDLLSVDKDLVRVKGTEGYSALHYVARKGNFHLISRFLDHCHGCILDLTFRKQSALHIAAQNNRFEALQAILQWIQRASEDNQFQKSKILNIQDKDGNTVLHIAASNNQTQMIKLLISSKEVDKNKINQHGFTALDVLQRQTLVDTRESVKILNLAPSLKVSRTENKLTDFSRQTTPETVNALLVVFSLVLNMTYQSVLSPPGGFSQGGASAAGNSNTDGDEGKAVMDSSQFLLFYIPNMAAFLMAWAITSMLVGIVSKSIWPFLSPLYLLMGFCYGSALAVTAPSTNVGFIAGGCGIFMFFLIYYISIFRFRK